MATKNTTGKKTLTAAERDKLIGVLQARFE